MGDRGNVHIVSDKGTKNENNVWLYTHWDASNLRKTVKQALIRGKSRWDDAQYLARIIFCEMIKDDVEGLMGYGITSVEWDGGKTVIVDIDNQTVNGESFKQFTES